MAGVSEGSFVDLLLPQSFASIVPAAVAFCSFDRGMCSNEQYGRVPFLDTQDQRCSTKKLRAGVFISNVPVLKNRIMGMSS